MKQEDFTPTKIAVAVDFNPADFITINEAARIKGCSRQAIHAAIAANRLSCVEVLEPVRRIARVALDLFEINTNMQRSGKRRKSHQKPRGRNRSPLN